MKIIINDQIIIPSVTRINEILEVNTPQRVVIICDYSQNLFEILVNLNNNIINSIKIYEDDNLLNILLDYKYFYKIIHHQGKQGEFIELSFTKEDFNIDS